MNKIKQFVLCFHCLSSRAKLLSSSSMQECCGCELINHALPPSFEKIQKEELTAGQGRLMVPKLILFSVSKPWHMKFEGKNERD